MLVEDPAGEREVEGCPAVVDLALRRTAARPARVVEQNDQLLARWRQIELLCMIHRLLLACTGPGMTVAVCRRPTRKVRLPDAGYGRGRGNGQTGSGRRRVDT